MKKTILLLAGAMMLACSASAQVAVVKNALKSVTSSSKPEELKSVLQSLQPALTAAESKNDAATWFAAGKASFQLYDALNAAKMMNKEVDAKEMQEALMNGYNYFKTALPLDTVYETNKDGSFKTDKNGVKRYKAKYSKDILATLQGHLSDFANVANTALSAQNWVDAAAGFGLYGDMLAQQTPAIADSSMAEIRFFQGYSQYQNKDFAGAFKSFSEAIKKGYTDNNVNDFQYSSLGNVAQAFMDAGNMPEAQRVVDDAIASDPNNANYLNLKGILVERNSNLEQALPLFIKATEIDPKNSQAQFNVGRYYYNQAAEFVKNNPDLLGDALMQKVKPYYEKCLPYLEKAYELDNNNTDAKNALRNIYYQLGDTAKYEEFNK